MSEQINKVLASTAQAFSIAEQKQARDNISAQAKITYSYSGDTITAIDGSAVGQPNALTSVVHDANLSGSGTSASPLGLASEITLSANGLPYINTIDSYSMYMHGDSATSYVGLGYNYFRDSAGGETYIHTDHITVADAGTCTLTAKPTSVEFFNGNDLDRFASYNLSGVVLSSEGANPVTARLRDTRLSFYESGKPSAYYDRTGLRFGNTADIMTTLTKNLKFEYDAGGNLENTTYGLNGFSGTTYTPTGTNHDTGVIATYGISGVNSFGDYKIWDNWRSSKRAQLGGNGEEKSVLDMYIGYNNGESELYPAYIGFYNPHDGSAFIYQSSIGAWNDVVSAALRSVSVSSGLSGNGTSGSPLVVTGIVNHYESPYSTSDFKTDRTSIDIFTDEYSARIHDGGLWFTYGGNVFHSAHVELRPDDFSIRDFTTQHSYYLTPSAAKQYNHSASASSELCADHLTLSNSSCTATVYPEDLLTIGWPESANSLSTGWGGTKATAASQFRSGNGNWMVRRLKANGVPDTDLIGFGAMPTATESLVGNQGQFIAYHPGYSAIYLSGTGTTQTPHEDLGSSYLPTGVTWPMRVDVINIGVQRMDIKTDTFYGTTALLDKGESATVWYIPALNSWRDIANL